MSEPHGVTTLWELYKEWVRTGMIANIGSRLIEVKAGRLVMDFDHEVRDDYLMDDPEAAAPSPVLDAESDSFSSAGELAERREEMEHGGPPTY